MSENNQQDAKLIAILASICALCAFIVAIVALLDVRKLRSEIESVRGVLTKQLADHIASDDATFKLLKQAQADSEMKLTKQMLDRETKCKNEVQWLAKQLADSPKCECKPHEPCKCPPSKPCQCKGCKCQVRTK